MGTATALRGAAGARTTDVRTSAMDGAPGRDECTDGGRSASLGEAPALHSKGKQGVLEPDRRHMACPSGPLAHTARPPRLSGRDTRARTYSSGL
jgi:hypothetical protein